MLYKDEPHLYIFTGHFGSGKTEVAVNFALDHKRTMPDAKVALIDMDIINPFFRSADARGILEKNGIVVETMLYANTNVDAPALTGRMASIIEDRSSYVILDIGGDDLGARACGYYADIINNRPHTVYFVMNPFRPFTAEPELALKVFREIENATLTGIDEILDNSNLLDYTDHKTIAHGSSKTDAIAKQLGLPVRCRAVMKKNSSAVACAEALFPPEEILLMDEYVKLLFSRT